MALDGAWWILLLFALVQSSWLLFNAAAWIIGRCKRFSVRSLLVLMTVVALLLGFAPTTILRFPEAAALGVVLVLNMIVAAAIIRNVASK